MVLIVVTPLSCLKVKRHTVVVAVVVVVGVVVVVVVVYGQYGVVISYLGVCSIGSLGR